MPRCCPIMCMLHGRSPLAKRLLSAVSRALDYTSEGMPYNKPVTDSFPVVKHSTRSSNLQSTFHFTCECTRCQDHRRSDSRVTTIESIEASLSDWSPTSSTTRKRNGPRLAQELIKLYEEDGLHAVMVRPYGLAAQEYSALKDAKRARKYAELAISYGLLKEGEGGEDVKAMQAIVRDVKSHWSWGKRAPGYL